VFQIDGPDSVENKPAKKPAANTPGWFDGGDPSTNKSATQVTRDWLNTIQAEIANVIEGADIALDRGDDSQLFEAIKKLVNITVNEGITNMPDPPSPLPTGSVLAFPGSVAPEGFFLCNGQSFSASAYPKLYAVLGKTTVPNYQGCFLRMVGGSAGALGATQEDAGRNVTGLLNLPRAFQDDSIFTANSALTYQSFTDIAGRLANAAHAGRGKAEIGLDASRCWGTAHTAGEFRPKNVAVNYIIRHD
jgi:hypothetical protein